MIVQNYRNQQELYSANENDVHRQSARNMGLNKQPSVTMSLLATTKTTACREAIHALAERIFEGVGRKQRPSDQYRNALAAMVADLLKGMSHSPVRPCFRPMGASCFSEKAVGYHAFTRALKDLERHECGSAWKRDPGSGVIGVEKGPLIPVF